MKILFQRSFVRFIEDTTSQYICSYFEKLRQAFVRHSDEPLRAERILKDFVPSERQICSLREHDHARGLPAYEFELQVGGMKETWNVFLYLTELSNVEAGVVRPKCGMVRENDKSKWALGDFLLRNNLASIIEDTCILGSEASDSIPVLRGKRGEIYFLLKCESHSSLSCKFRENPIRDAASHPLMQLRKHVVGVLGDELIELVIQDNDRASDFLRLCDEKVRSNVAADTLAHWFESTSVTPDEWFSTGV